MIELGLLLIGLVIFLGFFSSLFFERTKIPDVLILLLTGMLLGPIFRIVDPANFISWASFIGTLALIVILFDAGLGLNVFKVVTEFSKAAAFTVTVFLLTAVLTVAGGVLLLGMPLFHALLLAFVVGGTSSSIVVPIVNRLSVKEEVRTILSLESVITDVFCVVFTVALLEIIRLNQFNAAATAGDLASAFSIALVLGFLFGLFWLKILRSFFGKPLGYVVTLGVMFILFNFVEVLGGSGAVGVLVFALVLGNCNEIASLLKIKEDLSLDRTIKTTQSEVSFFVRTFFLVYLGLIFRVSAVSVEVLFAAGAVILAAVIARMVGVRILIFIDKTLSRYSPLLTTMMPRGLVAAVLAFFPANAGIEIPHFVEIVFLVVLSTNLIATAGVFFFERSEQQETVAENKLQAPVVLNKQEKITKSVKAQ